MKEIDWADFVDALKQDSLPLMDEPLRDAREKSMHTSRGRAGFFDDGLAAFEDEAFDATVDAMVRAYAGDPEGVWEKLTYTAYDPKRVLRALRNHHDADSGIDPMLLMETFMHEYDYRYANNARFAIGTIVGHKHMRLVRTRGKSYWQAGLGGV